MLGGDAFRGKEEDDTLANASALIPWERRNERAYSWRCLVPDGMWRSGAVRMRLQDLGMWSRRGDVKRSKREREREREGEGEREREKKGKQEERKREREEKQREEGGER